MKKKFNVLEPNSYLQIPVGYTPTIIGKSNCTLIIQLGNIIWRYPITGITETKADKTDFKLSTYSRKLDKNEFVLGPFKGLESNEKNIKFE